MKILKLKTNIYEVNIVGKQKHLSYFLEIVS